MAVAALLAALPAPASAAAPPSWSQKADAIAAPWPGLQEADGRFRDYVLARDPSDERDDYGEPMLGYGLLLSAARTGDAALADAGLRALEHGLDRPARSPSTQVFHQFATASAYNLARARFASHPVFTRARERWEAVLRAIEVHRLGRQKVTNKSIVEAILVIELARSGLRSDAAGLVATVKRFLRTELPRAAAPYELRDVALLGDLPLLPPAYHALSVGMLARTIELLGDEAPSAARSLLVRAADASLGAAAPDGEIAYHGRSQSQAWALTLTAYGAERAGGDANRGLARDAVDRLIRDYPTGAEGLMVTPSLAQDVGAAIPGIDEYATAVSYGGLTLATFEWAIAAAGAGAGGRPTSPALLGTGAGSWATARHGDVWYAVKRSRTSTRDLRYDFGLVALKEFSGGRWRDAMPLRPRTVGGFDGVLKLGSAVADGTRLRLASRGRILVDGGFRSRSGRWVRRGVTFTFTPVGCGVRMTWPARRGDRYGYSGFFRARPRRSGRTVRDATQSIRFRSVRVVATEGPYASGADVGLTRSRVEFRGGAVEICAR